MTADGSGGWGDKKTCTSGPMKKFLEPDTSRRWGDADGGTRVRVLAAAHKRNPRYVLAIGEKARRGDIAPSTVPDLDGRTSGDQFSFILS